MGQNLEPQTLLDDLLSSAFCSFSVVNQGVKTHCGHICVNACCLLLGHWRDPVWQYVFIVVLMFGVSPVFPEIVERSAFKRKAPAFLVFGAVRQCVREGVLV